MVPPKVDERSYSDLVTELEQRVIETTKHCWLPPKQGKPRDVGAALIAICARFGEQVIERINRMPEKSFLAFLDLVGIRPQPPLPARVPLSFELKKGHGEVRVPAATQIAASALEDETEAPIFELEHDVWVDRTRLVAVRTRDAQTDRWADHTTAALTAEETFAPFEGDRPIDRFLYLGHDSLGLPGLEQITLKLTLDDPDDRERLAQLEWSAWDGLEWRPSEAQTMELDDGVLEVALEGLPAIPPHTVGARTTSFVRARWASGNAGPSPRLTGVGLQLAWPARDDFAPDLVTRAQEPVDLGRDFFPFGEQPRQGEALYLASEEAFTQPGATIVISLLTTPRGGAPSPGGGDDYFPPVPPTPGTVLAWEVWDQDEERWQPISGVVDTTDRLTRDGTIQFPCPSRIDPVTVNGEHRRFVRVRLDRGGYGRAEYYRLADPEDPSRGYVLIPSTLSPTSLRSLRLGRERSNSFVSQAAILTENHRIVTEHNPGQPLVPFVLDSDPQPTLYLGFEHPGAPIGFANRATALYFQPVETGDPSDPASPGAVEVAWEYWNGDRWWALSVDDQTHGFSRRGLLSFVGPADFHSSTELGLEAFWLRARRLDDGSARPRLYRVATHTAWATQVETQRDEVLGSGTGEPDQRVVCARPPVLPGQWLQVRGPLPPPVPEQHQLIALGGPEALVPADESPAEIWEQWQEVTDFHQSGPRCRHYTLDRLTGEVRFGDGRRGMPPPRGTGNIRMSCYRTGGGTVGNRPSANITRLVTSIPGIAKVLQPEPSAGGADGEPLEALQIRGPRELRHRGRAVAASDYEDLARAASTRVARAIVHDADEGAGTGMVTVVVVPGSDEAQPIPSPQLLEEVETYLVTRAPATCRVRVVGPTLSRVDVTVEAVPVAIDDSDAVRRGIRDRLDHFLHPLTGGPSGNGWEPGCRPRRGEILAEIDRVPGVDHVRRVDLVIEAPDAPDSLIFSGQHTIEVVGPGVTGPGDSGPGVSGRGVSGPGVSGPEVTGLEVTGLEVTP